MARNQRDIKGWQYRIETSGTKDGPIEPSTPTRRSRRGKIDNESIILTRESDDLQIKVGETIMVQQDDTESPQSALIKEIRFGNDNFIDIIVLWFIKINDIEFKDLPMSEEYKDKNNLIKNELFLTAYLDEIQLSEIIDKVNVLSQEEFKKDIVIDESNSATTFMCRRACNSEGELFTEIFDYRTLYILFEKDQAEFLEYIRRGTIPLAYSSKKVHPKERKSIEKKIEEVTQQSKLNEKRRRKKIERFDEELNDSDESMHEYVSESIESDASSNEESDTEFKSKEIKTPKRKYRKSTDNKSSKHSKNNYVSKIDDESRKYINSVLSPLKKRLKIKQDSSKPSLLALSPQKPKSQTNVPGVNSFLDSSSEAFKELKAKLHTSAKISSLPCREDEFTSVYLNLEAAIQEETGCCLYVSGTPGVGKTATIREVISQLKELSNQNELNEFEYLEINGLKLLSPNVAYEVLWEKISGLKVSASNAALLLEGYFSQESNKKPLVVLMDELDQIVTKKQGVMYNFFNWPTYSNSKLIVIAVANTMDLPERVLSNKISSRLGLRRIQFIGYTFEQLGEIITHRLALIAKQKKNVVVSQDAIGFASRKVASVSGDARRALTICRRAVEVAEKEYLANEKDGKDGIYYIQISHIVKAINETVNSPTASFLSSLPFASKLVLVAILLRMKRSGLADNSLGDIIDEMKNSLILLTSKEGNKVLDSIDSKVDMVSLLYGNRLLDGKGKINIRSLNFNIILSELVENGIIMQQNCQSERYRLINLNVSEAEILSVLKRDKEISGMI